MVETYKDKIADLGQFLKNPNNFKNNESLLLKDISEYSIFNLNE